MPNRKPNHETITTTSVEDAERTLQSRSVTGARLAHDTGTCTWSTTQPLWVDCACEPAILLYLEPAGLF